MELTENNNINQKFDTLAPCGVFCGACPAFNKTCKGCASKDKAQDRRSKWSCKIRNCCYDRKGLDYCIYCAEFPCKIFHKKLLSSHQDDSRYTYRFEIPVIFPGLKKMGIEKYLDFQKQRWKCHSCSGTIQFYHYRCNRCGKEQVPAVNP